MLPPQMSVSKDLALYLSDCQHVFYINKARFQFILHCIEQSSYLQYSSCLSNVCELVFIYLDIQASL